MYSEHRGCIGFVQRSGWGKQSSRSFSHLFCDYRGRFVPEKGGGALLLFVEPMQDSSQEWCGHIASHSGWVCVDARVVHRALEVVSWASWACVVAWVCVMMVLELV